MEVEGDAEGAAKKIEEETKDINDETKAIEKETEILKEEAEVEEEWEEIEKEIEQEIQAGNAMISRDDIITVLEGPVLVESNNKRDAPDTMIARIRVSNGESEGWVNYRTGHPKEK